MLGPGQAIGNKSRDCAAGSLLYQVCQQLRKTGQKGIDANSKIPMAQMYYYIQRTDGKQ